MGACIGGVRAMAAFPGLMSLFPTSRQFIGFLP
jgi:hypothetical protein